MPLAEQIFSSDEKYKAPLEMFFCRVFKSFYLPSHDLNHHKRVWKNAEKILYSLHEKGLNFSQKDIDNLIIACYLHDSGMVVDKGPSHGSESRKLCEQFLTELKLSSDEFIDALTSIENHDNKGYRLISRPEEPCAILSVSDDIDAFGFIGIYRYLEIYIERDLPLIEIGRLVCENSSNRFRNFITTYRMLPELIAEQTIRYNTLNSFFEAYDKQAAYYKFDRQAISGHCGVAEIIKERITKSEPINQSFLTAREYNDPLIEWYFTELENELSGITL